MAMTPKYKHIFIRNLELAESINIGGGHSDQSLPMLAKRWVKRLVANGAIPQNKTGDKMFLAQAMLKNDAAEDVDASITTIVQDLKAKGFGQSIDKLMALLGRKYASARHNTPDEDSSGSGQNEDESEHVQECDPPQRDQRLEMQRDQQACDRKLKNQRERDARRNGSFDIELRRQISTRKGFEKLDLLQQCKDQADNKPESEKFSAAMRSFSTQILLPILRCLEHHCGGDKSVFLSRWGENFSHTSFSSTKCSGRGTVCNGTDARQQ